MARVRYLDFIYSKEVSIALVDLILWQTVPYKLFRHQNQWMADSLSLVYLKLFKLQDTISKFLTNSSLPKETAALLLTAAEINKFVQKSWGIFIF